MCGQSHVGRGLMLGRDYVAAQKAHLRARMQVPKFRSNVEYCFASVLEEAIPNKLEAREDQHHVGQPEEEALRDQVMRTHTDIGAQ